MSKKRTKDMDTNDAIDVLRRNKCVINGRNIMIPKVGPGIKIWGVIDFLRNKHKFQVGRQGGEYVGKTEICKG